MGKREATWGIPGAAVHRHILYRMNASNDSLKKILKKGRWRQKVNCLEYYLVQGCRVSIHPFLNIPISK